MQDLHGRNVYPGVAEILQYFEYKHLPEDLAMVSAPFCDLAEKFALESNLIGPEVIAGLRKLLEAKDCFVRAAVTSPHPDD